MAVVYRVTGRFIKIVIGKDHQLRSKIYAKYSGGRIWDRRKLCQGHEQSLSLSRFGRDVDSGAFVTLATASLCLVEVDGYVWYVFFGKALEAVDMGGL